MPSVAALPDVARALDARATCADTPCGRGHLRWRVWGDGPPLLLLHGGSGSWMHWLRTIETMARTHRVIAPDTPGLGQSARTDAPEELGSYARALAAGLPTVCSVSDGIDVAAFSFGSIVAGALIAEGVVPVRKLVLVGPAALGVSKLDRPLVGVRHLHGDARRQANAQNLAILMFADPALITEDAIDIQEWNTRHTRIDSRRFARTTTLRDALDAWGRPFAAVIGEKDATSQPPLVVPVLEGLRSDAPIRILPGIGHWCMFEAPDVFNAALIESLAAL